ncbi:MAG: hypothetical protein SFV54_09385 [Bryobacteraceae bacterium]|nr:hypothetical protein [Bryobacteraceae bacterium]
MPATKTTTLALFADWKQAEEAVQRLAAAGVARERVSIVANREACGPGVGPVENIGADSKAGTGAAIGGLAGFAAGVVALAIPGIGAILAAGPFAAGLVGAGLGAAAGGLIGKLREAGVPESEAGCYCEAVRRGGILVAVNTTEADAERVSQVLGEFEVLNLDTCRMDWQRQGWKGFRPDADAQELGYDPNNLRPSSNREESKGVRRYVRIT